MWGVKVIEGEYRVLSEDGVPVEAKARRRASGYAPLLWFWAVMVGFVGLTEGW